MMEFYQKIIGIQSISDAPEGEWVILFIIQIFYLTENQLLLSFHKCENEFDMKKLTIPRF